MNKNRRKMEVRVELRPNSHENKKNFAGRRDSWALVEVRSGLVVRWMLSEAGANKEKERINNGGRV